MKKQWAFLTLVVFFTSFILLNLDGGVTGNVVKKAPLLLDGEPCHTHKQCSSNMCYPKAPYYTRQCISVGEPGQVCEKNSDCASNSCVIDYKVSSIPFCE